MPMDNSRRKPGRPKSGQRTMPLVLDTDWSVTMIELELPTETVEALREYAAWVQQRATMTIEAATNATVNFALRHVFRRDRLWQEHRKNPDGHARAASTPSASAPQPSPAPSLPPPSAARPLPGPNGAGGSR
jgi:hypothetical protein